MIFEKVFRYFFCLINLVITWYKTAKRANKISLKVEMNKRNQQHGEHVC